MTKITVKTGRHLAALFLMGKTQPIGQRIKKAPAKRRGLMLISAFGSRKRLWASSRVTLTCGVLVDTLAVFAAAQVCTCSSASQATQNGAFGFVIVARDDSTQSRTSSSAGYRRLSLRFASGECANHRQDQK
ncbi:hypothetical protein EE36_08443 [Sulfitobacter sp. EE-36]|nr:hypothetical protein EE36_08443 [Sulfitobacter sp. EE-36]